MDPVKRAEHMAMMREARLADIADKRARGERVDHMAPETRKRVSQAGGKARAAKRWREATDAEREESANKLPQARAVLAATRTWLRPPGDQLPWETLLVRDHQIRLPMSGPRSKRDISWCKLLAAADPTLAGCYAFTGENPRNPASSCLIGSCGLQGTFHRYRLYSSVRAHAATGGNTSTSSGNFKGGHGLRSAAHKAGPGNGLGTWLRWP